MPVFIQEKFKVPHLESIKKKKKSKVGTLNFSWKCPGQRKSMDIFSPFGIKLNNIKYINKYNIN